MVSREGAPDYLAFTVIRDEISRKSVPDAFWLKPGIAYIKILQFGENTGRELEENLKRLGENNIKGLVLDLRGNPGGLLNEGVAVADHFLPKGAVDRVAPRARPRRRRPTSRSTAITAATTRSWCWWTATRLRRRRSSPARCRITIARWILGETTFGKGLVQTVSR